MSIARTTPAQNPRGFNNSKVFACNFPVSDKSIPHPLGYTFSLKKML